MAVPKDRIRLETGTYTQEWCPEYARPAVRDLREDGEYVWLPAQFSPNTSVPATSRWNCHPLQRSDRFVADIEPNPLTLAALRRYWDEAREIAARKYVDEQEAKYQAEASRAAAISVAREIKEWCLANQCRIPRKVRALLSEAA